MSRADRLTTERTVAAGSRASAEAMREAAAKVAEAHSDYVSDHPYYIPIDKAKNATRKAVAAAIRALPLPAPDERGGEEVERLRHVIDRDRYIAARALNTIQAALSGRQWLRGPARGSYAYDDERYQQEFGAALDEIEAALDPLARLAADKSDCTTDPAKVQAARYAAVARTPEPVSGDAGGAAARVSKPASELQHWLDCYDGTLHHGVAARFILAALAQQEAGRVGDAS